jgi:hypothetical protein
MMMDLQPFGKKWRSENSGFDEIKFQAEKGIAG